MFWHRRRRLDEEVASHLAEETADNIERGMTPAAARNAALRAFGNVEAAKERARERDPFYWFDTVCQDVRFAFRLIARNPWLSVTIVATLTVGIGLNVSVFSLLNGFFLQPWSAPSRTPSSPSTLDIQDGTGSNTPTAASRSPITSGIAIPRNRWPPWPPIVSRT